MQSSFSQRPSASHTTHDELGAETSLYDASYLDFPATRDIQGPYFALSRVASQTRPIQNPSENEHLQYLAAEAEHFSSKAHLSQGEDFSTFHSAAPNGTLVYEAGIGNAQRYPEALGRTNTVEDTHNESDLTQSQVLDPRLTSPNTQLFPNMYSGPDSLPQLPLRQADTLTAEPVAPVQQTEGTLGGVPPGTRLSRSERRLRARTELLTPVCGKVTPKKEFKGPIRKRIGGQFFCSNCQMGFRSQSTVKEHFPSCVQKLGNPNRVRWIDHPSIKGYTNRKTRLTEERLTAIPPAEETNC